MSAPLKQSSRKTSKLALAINTGLAWSLAFYSLFTGQGGAAVSYCLALIGALYGSYVGIGHLDYRRFLVSLYPQEEYNHFSEDNHYLDSNNGFPSQSDCDPMVEGGEGKAPSRTH